MQNFSSLSFLKEKKILYIGYGSQGRAQALNLRDSGIKNIYVALPENSKTISKVEIDKFQIHNLKKGVQDFDLIVMASPDETHQTIYENFIDASIKPGATLLFMHGFSVHFKYVKPKPFLDVILVSPKGPGPQVRSEYEKGRGIISLIAVEQDYTKQAQNCAYAYAKALGSDRSAILKTSFREECECDLFGEQVVLCGGLSELLRKAYETLVEAGYSPEIAYFECIHEIKLLADLVYQNGIGGMNKFISNTAEWGEYVSGKLIITDETKKAMENILKNIQTGRFAKDWMKEYQEGLKNFYAQRHVREQEEREKVGQKIRSFMPWIQK